MNTVIIKNIALGIAVLIVILVGVRMHRMHGEPSVTVAPLDTPSTTMQIQQESPQKSTGESREHFIKPSDSVLRSMLTPLQYQVTQQEGTEQPYANEYFDTHADGIYVDRVSGEPLFSSKDKYDSGTGWPSFVRPLVEANIVYKTDGQLGIERTEVRSLHADSHLGHVFNDGPVDRGGKRYCMNSAALRFIPKASMESEGYGAYLSSV